MATDVKTIIDQLVTQANPQAVQGMARFGIKPDMVFGWTMPQLREYGKRLGRNHELAQQLWQAKYRETMILAALTDDPKQVSEQQMEQWVADFYDWESCDQCIMNLFEKTALAWRKAEEWAERQEEFVKRAGFVLMARLAVSDKKTPDDRFEPFFAYIVREAGDSRNGVKKAVNWALRQIGKRNLTLCEKAIQVGEEIRKQSSTCARWVAADALRELRSESVQRRLNLREGV
ncbi:MAG TPA: DNA alkylation repair protein [bacterium]|nr:DNA alkylation repair protein [bacterium]HPN42869.1 DNA alkylation repair protein [bacterium]